MMMQEPTWGANDPIVSGPQLAPVAQPRPQAAPQRQAAPVALPPRPSGSIDLNRMASITAQSESGNRERDPRTGALITSPKGAQGRMQVMPTTNTSPGFGVVPARDGSDAERTRVGRDYLAAMMQQYGGDPAKAWAAYNWGPGNFDAAVARHGENWFRAAPAETQAYVAQNLRALGMPAPEVTADFTSAPAGQEWGQTDPVVRETQGEFNQEAFDAMNAANLPAPEDRFPRDRPFVIREGLTGDDAALQNNTAYSIKKGDWVQEPDGTIYQAAADAYADRNAPREDTAIGSTGIYSRTPDFEDSARAFVSAAAEQVPGLDEAAVAGVAALEGRSFSDVRDDYRTMVDIDNQANRGERIAGGFTGAGLTLLAPGVRQGGSFIAGGANAVDKTIRAGLLGTGTGVVYGAGAADGGVEERAQGALLGGLTGAGAGAVGQQVVNKLMQPAANNSNLLNRDVGRVQSLLDRGLRRDNTTRDQWMQNIASGPEGQLPFGAAGRNMETIAEVAASSPGSAQTMLDDALSLRSAQAPDRINRRLGESFGAQGGGLSAIEEGIASRSAAANQGMRQFGNETVVLNEDAIRAVRSPRAQAAIRNAAENRMSSMDPVVSESANRLNRLLDTALDNPAAATITVRDAQDLSYALKEGADGAFSSGDNALGRTLSGLSRGIRTNAREAVPAYDSWLREFGDASEQIDALRLGRSVFSGATERNRTSATQLQQQFDDLSPLGQDQFRRGVGEAILERSRGTRGGVAAMRDLLRSQEFGDRIRIAFPSEDAFSRFMASAGDEVGFQNQANRLLGNSRTDPRAAARADMTAMDGIDTQEALDVGANLLTLNGRGLLGNIARGITRRIPNTGENIVANERTNRLLGEAITNPDAAQAIMGRRVWDRSTDGILSSLTPASQEALNSVYQATDSRLATEALTELARLAQRTPALLPFYEDAARHVAQLGQIQPQATQPALLSPQPPTPALLGGM